MEADSPSECLRSTDEPPPWAAPAAAGAEPADWHDWRWQMRHRIRSLADLGERFPALRGGPDLAPVAARYPLAITPYYASLIRRADLSDPVFQIAVPQMDELYDPAFLEADPLEEEAHTPVPGLIHRYADRALVIATTMCSVYCRHCTRKRMAGMQEAALTDAQLEGIAAYLRAHPGISDVIVSGGDPLTLATPVLEKILTAVRAVPSVEIVRIGTRAPVVLPQRITRELTAMLRRFHPLWLNTHFNHPRELTPAAAAACARLADAGIPLGNQTVLLRGVNDRPEVIERLCRGLVRMRVRPYYLFQCDLVRGIEHFRTPLDRGLEIMEYLRGRLSGLAIPVFAVDAPHGGGKIPLLPHYVVSTSPTHTVLRNAEGLLLSYPEPGARPGDTEPRPDARPSVWDLACGRRSVLFQKDAHGGTPPA